MGASVRRCGQTVIEGTVIIDDDRTELYSSTGIGL